MNHEPYSLTIPAFSVHGLLTIVLCVSLIALYAMILTKTGVKKQSVLEQICDRLKLSHAWGWALPPLGLFVVVLGIGTAWDFMQAVFAIGPYGSEKPADGSAIRNIGLVLAAFLGAPFVIWRSVIAAKQANTQVEALFNDKINAAAADLAARRQVTRVAHGKDGIETILTEWQDDLVTRAAAIDRLEGLAQEPRDATPRIARQLSIYVRELSREFPAETPPDGASPEELKDWAGQLEVRRPDMEKAAQTLGRLREIENHGLKRGDIDLRNANLQGFDLAELNFTEGLFDDAELQGAKLNRAQMQGAGLNRAQMQGAKLNNAQMQGAKLFRAQMQGAWLNNAQMQGAKLNNAQMQGAWLNNAQMDRDTDLKGATLRGAAVRSVDDTTLAQLRPFLADIFADGSVTVPEDARPAHWPKEALDLQEFYEAWET